MSGRHPRRLVAAAVSLIVVLAAAAAGASERARVRPNILYIISDDQGYGDFSASGNQVLATPRLDALRRQSVVLTRFYVSPLCSPTRAALMTGRHGFRTGVWDTWQGRSNLAPDEETIAELLAPAGYRTALFGKWHLGDNLPFRPQDQGFARTYIFVGDDRFNPEFLRNGTPEVRGGRFVDDAVVDEALSFLAERHGQPFFACVALFMPHTHFKAQIAADYVRPFENIAGLLPGDREIYGMTTNLDENVGRLLDGLRERGLERDTVVVFHSDNGPQFGTRDKPGSARYNAGLRGNKGSVYEGGIRVPCFLRWPGRLIPREFDTPTAAIDVLPTLLAIAGAAPAARRVDGLNLWPWLLGEQDPPPPRHLFQQQQPQLSGRDPELYANAAIIGPRFKAVWTRGESSAELFDLAADPGETRSLATAQPEVLAELRRHYQAWFEDVSAERGFAPLPTLVGDPRQPEVTIGHSYVNERHGYPVRVARAGRYRVEFRQLQRDLFPEGGAIGWTAGGSVWKTSVQPGGADLAFEIELPAGALTLRPYHEGKLPRKFAYGNEDLGFRTVQIRGPLPPEGR